MNYIKKQYEFYSVRGLCRLISYKNAVVKNANKLSYESFDGYSYGYKMFGPCIKYCLTEDGAKNIRCDNLSDLDDPVLHIEWDDTFRYSQYYISPDDLVMFNYRIINDCNDESDEMFVM